ncbi:hypothetical protein JTB14_017699 [Gonioctena quinquepunctata]|nr:hypothetical protein JTB14_017699 [Gonioctena quinquepunctata]
MGPEMNPGKKKRLNRTVDGKNKNIKIDTHTIEQVDRFRYLGIIIISDGSNDAEMNERTMNTNRVYRANTKLITSKLLENNAKMRGINNNNSSNDNICSGDVNNDQKTRGRRMQTQNLHGRMANWRKKNGWTRI